MGDLPLALHLAGSFLATYRDNAALGSPVVYLKQLRGRPLLQHPSLEGRGARLAPTGHELHVAKTFALSYDQLAPADTADALALRLVARAAHFAPGIPIPRDLLLTTLSLADDDLDGRLLTLGLMEQEREDVTTLRLHQLLAVFVRGVATDDTAQTAVADALVKIVGQLNRAGIPIPLLPLQPHLRHVTDAAVERADQQAARLCNELGYYLKMVGDLAGARPYYERSLAIRQQELGLTHPNIATSLNNLGSLLHDQGDYAGARSYLERALAIIEQVLGPKHPNAQIVRNNLASLDAIRDSPPTNDN